MSPTSMYKTLKLRSSASAPSGTPFAEVWRTLYATRAMQSCCKAAASSAARCSWLTCEYLNCAPPTKAACRTRSVTGFFSAPWLYFPKSSGRLRRMH